MQWLAKPWTPVRSRPPPALSCFSARTMRGSPKLFDPAIRSALVLRIGGDNRELATQAAVAFRTGFNTCHCAGDRRDHLARLQLRARVRRRRMPTRSSRAFSAERRSSWLKALPRRSSVHGGFVDGSGWEGVYKILRKSGYDVSIVQNPTLSLVDDVAATRRIVARQQAPVILVGHSYGGVVITRQVGNAG